MTVLAVSMDRGGAEIVTDTEHYRADGTFAYKGSKCYTMPEYDLAFVNHGMAGIGARLYLAAQKDSAIEDFDTLMNRGHKAAMQASRELRQEFVEDDNEAAMDQLDRTEIMVVGYSGELGRFAAGILSGASGFQGKVANHEYFAFGSSTKGIEQAMSALGHRPEGPQELMAAIGFCWLRGQEEHEHAWAGGDLIHTELTQGAVFQKKVGTLEDAAALARRYEKPHREGPKVGRNEPCPCGSGQKAKRCCGAD